MQKALRHPFGIMLLLASLVQAGLALSVLDRWSGQAPWIILLGLLAYAASITVLHLTRPFREQSNGTDPERDSQDFSRFVQKALRQLNNPAALSQCELVYLLPRTLGELTPLEKTLRWLRRLLIWLRPGSGVPTALGKARVLREVLIAAIDQLKPPVEPPGAGAPEALQYQILHEAYVQRRPVAYVLTRHNIAERTYFRHRGDAVAAVVRHLEAQEESLRTGGAKVAETG